MTVTATGAAHPRAVRWGLPDVLVGVVAFVVLSAVVRVLVRLPGVGGEAWLVLGIEQVVSGWLPLVAVVLLATWWRGRRSLALDFGLRFRPVDVAVGLAVGVGLRLAALGLAEVVRQLSGTRATAFAGGVGDPVLFVVFAVLAASVVSPVVEELYFRGLALRAIERAVAPAGAGVRGAAGAEGTGAATDARRRRAAVIAVLGSALLFTVFHLDGVPETAAAASRLLTLFVVGVVLGVLAVVTGRLGPSIVAHGAFNLTVAVLELVTPPAVGG
ncbi:CPBP family glutamic-type intramembrane protease [Herbiconiux sp. CPCC 205716]|uniref:CPBP family glutamic-type intramembrane protease n=1 Tax=Herbiconiux gentiana TaxID=2970912 RepID=A0ABT2GCD4_9MICO|nr:CPBP family glutamic-type intramembrane protease [Herbiconiux gentiana]MCS5713813.1 CPBP family glutamic-type intramembrane protease [Herbiconiux gentiana]